MPLGQLLKPLEYGLSTASHDLLQRDIGVSYLTAKGPYSVEWPHKFVACF